MTMPQSHNGNMAPGDVTTMLALPLAGKQWDWENNSYDVFDSTATADNDDYDVGSTLWAPTDIVQLLCNVSDGNASSLAECGMGGGGPRLPNMAFTEERLLSVAIYAMLFVVAGVGNVALLVSLVRSRGHSKLNRLIMQLAIADLINAFVLIPLEVAWTITITWNAGDFMCRFMSFWRNFGLYLSSNVLIAISLDRYFAVVHPMSVSTAGVRGKIMIGFAWLLSAICSLPQCIIFHVETHPNVPSYTQCVTFNFFPSALHANAYNVFTMVAGYGLPLLVIIVSYSAILREIYRKSQETSASRAGSGGGLRRSCGGNLSKAKAKTLKMTIIIVLVFTMCWTPYYVIAAWYWFDPATARLVDPKVQRGLFMFAISNACMDPLVYGLFTINVHRDAQRCSQWLRRCLRRRADDKGMSTTASSANMSSNTERIYVHMTPLATSHNGIVSAL